MSRSCWRRSCATLGIEVTRTHPAGVSFAGSLEHGLRACLHSRTASRVVLSLASGPAADAEQFYASHPRAPVGGARRSRGHASPSTSSATPRRGCATRPLPRRRPRTRSSIASASAMACDRPSISTIAGPARQRAIRPRPRYGRDRPERRSRCTSAATASRRVEAPLKENLAAALLLRCGWPEIAADGGAFVDPMCGSGTLVIEAALIAAQHRARACCDAASVSSAGGSTMPALWARLRTEALAARTMDALQPGRLRGIRPRPDSDPRRDREREPRRPRRGHLVFERREVAQLARVVAATGLVLVNPPYGVRLGDERELEPLYAELGRALLRCHPGLGGGRVHRRSRGSVARSACGRTVRTRSSTAPIEGRLLRFTLDADRASCRIPGTRAAGAPRRQRARGPVRRCSPTGCEEPQATLRLGATRGRRAAFASTTRTCPSTRLRSTSMATASATPACRNTRRRRRLPPRRRARGATRRCRCFRMCSRCHASAYT